jgi:hypothetical protein
MNISEELVTKLLEIVAAGLAAGLGPTPTPGDLCVEAAVCLAMGMPHGDRPACVSPFLRELKIRLNDLNWSSKEARASGLRRLAIAQLGSADTLDEKEFMRRVVEYAICTTLPRATNKAALVVANAENETATPHEAIKAALTAINTVNLASNTASAYVSYITWREATIGYVADRIIRVIEAAEAASVDIIGIRDKELSIFAEGIVQILVSMNVPGCKFVNLAPLEMN